MKKAGKISPSSSYFASLIIILPMKKDPSTLEVTYKLVVDSRKKEDQWVTWVLVLTLDENR